MKFVVITTLLCTAPILAAPIVAVPSSTSPQTAHTNDRTQDPIEASAPTGPAIGNKKTPPPLKGKILTAQDTNRDEINDTWTLDLTPDIIGDTDNNVILKRFKDLEFTNLVNVGVNIEVSVGTTNEHNTYKVVNWLSIGG